MIDAPGEGEGPAAVEDAAFDRDFELGGGGVFGGGLGAELLVPVGAELSAPETLGAAGGIARAEGEIGKLPDAQAGGAGVEGEFHADADGIRGRCGRKMETREIRVGDRAGACPGRRPPMG